jgi:hypothetical protein
MIYNLERREPHDFAVAFSYYVVVEFHVND